MTVKFIENKNSKASQNERRAAIAVADLALTRVHHEEACYVIPQNPSSHGIPSSPRAAAVAKFRLLTGHDCLCAHLFRFNLVTSPICVLCDTGQDMTAAHLDECSALNDLNCILKRYWRSRCLMT
ncbi:uncharacterized protein TNCV_4114551 [Trichonephila clavipes]|nr:uncharacterized protein TNCV_4114551 [Trichonephila clavipes]